MDIGELLSYKPVIVPKRNLDDDSELEEQEVEYLQRKKLKQAKPNDVEETQSKLITKEEVSDQHATETAEAVEDQNNVIQQILDTASNEVSCDMDESALKRMVLLFEKRTLKNQEMRVKFPDAPERFMQSEVELHEIIQEMRVIATVPDLYPLLVELQAVSSLLELLSHENTDIAVAVIDLLQEMTDVDILHESEEGANSLIDALLEHQICALLVQNLERLDESVKEESDGVHNTLGVIENIMEFRSDIVANVGKQGLIRWTLKRIRHRTPFDANKLYTTEILAILLHSSPENRNLLGELDGVDILLQQLAHYKRHDPSSKEEEEMMENLFDCLCCVLMTAENKERFLKGEGLQLMNLMLREKKVSRNGSLKVLGHSMSGRDGADNCNKFVDILGLRTIFPLFMKTPKKSKKRTLTIEEHEELVLSIIANMMRNCRGTQRQRLFNKFIENDYEKVDRLVELHLKYLDRANNTDEALELMKQRNSLPDDQLKDDEIYYQRLEGGLYTLQLVDYIILEICAIGPPPIKQRIVQLLNLRNCSLRTIRHVMREYSGNLGEGNQDWTEEEKEHILQLIDKF